MMLKLSHRLTIGVWLAAFLTTGALAAPPEEPAVPQISPAHREFLSRLARRTFRDKAMGRGDYEPGYVPAALRSLEAEVIARFHRDG